MKNSGYRNKIRKEELSQIFKIKRKQRGEIIQAKKQKEIAIRRKQE